MSVETFKHVMTHLGQQMDEDDVNEIIADLKVDNGYFKMDQLVKLLNNRK